MKKLFLSAFVTLAFAAYSLQQRPGGTAVTDPSPRTNNSGSGNLNSGNLANPFVPTTAPTSPPQTIGAFRDGAYTGDVTDAYYGNVQVSVTVQNGKIADVLFLDYPHDRETSIAINTQAMPYLKSEAISAQSANVDIVSGATQTSLAFIKSLQSALDKAR